MGLEIDAVTNACNAVCKRMKDSFKQLTLHYVVHHEGRRTEALSLAVQEISAHPASKAAIQIMGRIGNDETSALLGVAAARRPLLLGLASQASLLAICSINIGDYKNLKEIRCHAWHMAWHAANALHYYKMRTIEDTANGNSEVTVRQRNIVETVSANLRADVFAVLMAALNEDRDAIRRAAVERGLDSLQALPRKHPEHYPYPIALDAVNTAYDILTARNIPKKRIIEAAMRAAEEIGMTFDENTLRQWLAFSQPAQDMAWRGYKPEEVLSAAINTSEDTYVRAIGYMVSEIAEIKPSSILTIRENYSPFADEAFNENLHEKTVNRVFEDTITKGLKLNSARPFLDAANRQNNGLAEGHTIGWCAGALQAAATAFDAASRNNREPAVEARRQFEGEQVKTPWESLKQLGLKIVGQYRQNGLVTLNSLQELCGKEPTLAYVRKSLDTTIKDPAYQNNLQAANELSARPPAFDIGNRPTPRAPQPPRALQAGVPGPGLGGGGSSAVRTAVADKKQATESKTEDRE